MIQIPVAEVGLPGGGTRTVYPELSSARITTIQNAIRAGGTTGDCFRDYVIAKHGILSRDKEDFYCRVNAALSDRTGELFLAHYMTMAPVSYSPARGTMRDWVSSFRCGILTGDRLVFRMIGATTPSCHLPMRSYVFERHLSFSEVREDRKTSELCLVNAAMNLTETAYSRDYAGIVGTDKSRAWLVANRSWYDTSDSGFAEFCAKLKT